MLPIDAFMAQITSPLDEENAQEEILDAKFLAVSQQAKDLISEIVAEGAEQVLDEILRDSPELESVSPQYTPNENTHDRIDKENHVIFWSKSGVEPFVGVYKKTNPMGNDVERAGESEMFEEPIKEIDMEAVEAASHFLLRGIDEDTVGRVVADACRDCVQTDEAINKIRDLIKEDPRLDGYALNDDEVSGLNEYRHHLRQQFLGKSNPDVLNQSLYEDDMDQIKSDEEDLNDDKLNVANSEAELAKRKAEIAQDKADEVGSVFEGNVKPNKSSQMVAYMGPDGPQKLSEFISKMQQGPEFQQLLKDIEISGLNAIGDAGMGQAKPVDPTVQANPEVASPQSASPQAAPAPQAQPDQELDGLELPSI